MRFRTLPFVAATTAGLLLSAHGADSAPDTANGEVVLRCGDTAIDAQRLSTLFSRLGAPQRAPYGQSPQAQLRGYVDRVVSRDLLLIERGRKSGLLESERVRAQHKSILGDALVFQLRSKLLRESPITDAEVSAYYESHPELFRTPERIRILRLLVEDEAEAIQLIEKARAMPNLDDWRNLVREKSKDRATAERGGDLGFVAADGTTDIPELEVDGALYAAARKVKDGALVEQPVPEGKRFAVVWRRGSVAAKTLALSAEAPRIKQQLSEDRLDAELQKLLANLRREHLHEYNPVRLTGREFAQAGETARSTAPAQPKGAEAPNATVSSATKPRGNGE